MAEPTWFRVLYLLRLLAPELMEWSLRSLFIPGRGKSQKENWNKYILDITGAKSIVHPATVQSGEIKQD